MIALLSLAKHRCVAFVNGIHLHFLIRFWNESERMSGAVRPRVQEVPLSWQRSIWSFLCSLSCVRARIVCARTLQILTVSQSAVFSCCFY